MLFCKKRFSCKFRKIYKSTPKIGFRHRCLFPCESCEIFDNAFFKEPIAWLLLHKHSFCLYCPSTTFRLFKNDVTHIFWLNIFSAKFVDWEESWAQYFKLLSRSLFSTQPNIWDGASLAKIGNSLKPLSVFAKEVLLL